MAIHLNAEQKNLKRLLNEYETFVIPPYQRPYSWLVGECRQLYEDLIDAFNRPNDKDYFMGTIILAVADNQSGEYPRIVDGQQRMTTFWLMFKALSVLLPEVKTLDEMLFSTEWDGSGRKLRIKSMVNDANDRQMMEDIQDWSVNKYMDHLGRLEKEIIEQPYLEMDNIIDRLDNHMEAATMYFFYRFNEFHKTDETSLREFAKFLMTSVLIIPIEMHAQGIRDAEDKALVIFETLNNRGVDLSNSDIFKARLYSKAITSVDKDEFVNMWDTVVDYCKRLTIPIDSLFDIYKRISMAKENNRRRPIGVREYFDGKNGELSRHDYRTIMSRLHEIANILQGLKDMEVGTSRMAGWAQMLSVCSVEATWRDSILVAWIMENGIEDPSLEAFMVNLIKYCLFTGYGNYDLRTIDIIWDIVNHREVARFQKYKNMDIRFEHTVHSTELARLVLILEMGGGLLDYSVVNLVERKQLVYRRAENGKGHIGERRYYFDDGIGNLAFVPTLKAKESKDYEEYMMKLEKVDPECAALASGNARKYFIKDIDHRAERKMKVLRDFFKK